MDLESNESHDRSGIQVISRAADVLRSLENVPEGLSLGEIAKVVSLPRSTVQRIVNTLVSEGFLMAASPTAKVRLGPAILRLASSLDFDITKIMRPFMRDLSLEVKETVDLAVLRGGSVVFVDQILGKRRIIAVSAIGERFPLHCSANGKAILATLPPDAAKVALNRSLQEHKDYPLTDPNRLWQELETIRVTGIAYDREEHMVGLGAVGTAMADPCGGVFAISIPLPIQRFRRDEKILVEKLQEHRQRIMSRLQVE